MANPESRVDMMMHDMARRADDWYEAQRRRISAEYFKSESERRTLPGRPAKAAKRGGFEARVKQAFAGKKNKGGENG